eukprot:TRINITY_DN4496_c0_g1_i1.p1 TRINITY_DN4496_c0_g1~~TRINITY_DN4496_c0_g1_i1.p1  ORF type:complete len:588 (+),score=92.20 TRINITY_DN4496_c0_g1_i1:11-1774(+)
MSFFTQLLDNVKSLIFDDNTGIGSYSDWVNRFERKVDLISQQISESLMNQPESKNGFNEKLRNLNNAMQDICPVLEEVNFRFQRMEQSRDERLRYVRDLLLKFVSRLIIVLDKVEGTRYMTTFLSIIFHSLNRPEFNPVLLQKRDTSIRECLNRYNDLLVRVQILVQRRMQDEMPTTYSMELLHLRITESYAKLLALTFFRLGTVRSNILSTLETIGDVSYDLKDYFPHQDIPFDEEKLFDVQEDYLIDHEPVDHYDTDSQEFMNNYPLMFAWLHFEEYLERDNSSKLQSGGDAWLEWFLSKSMIVPLFTQEWVNQIQKMTLGSTINWKMIYGYDLLVKHYLNSLLGLKEFGRAITYVTSALVVTDTKIFNYYIRTLFSITEAYDFQAVTNCIMKLKPVLNTLKDNNLHLGDTFDASFYALGLGFILGSDYQQVLFQTLEMMYYSSSIFVGQTRRRLYLDFLIRKHFFRLFLHWDDMVRSYFIQLIVNTIVRISPDKVIIEQVNTHQQYLATMENSIDLEMYSVIEGYIQLVKDSKNNDFGLDLDFDISIEIYASKALEEYNYFISRRPNDYSKIPPLIAAVNFRDL